MAPHIPTHTHTNRSNTNNNNHKQYYYHGQQPPSVIIKEGWEDKVEEDEEKWKKTESITFNASKESFVVAVAVAVVVKMAARNIDCHLFYYTHFILLYVSSPAYIY